MTRQSELSVVLGDRLYHAEREWGRTPDEVPVGQISQLAVDSKGLVYVLQRADPPVLVFETTGAFRRAAWGHGQIADGHGISVAPDDRVLLVDRDAHEVLIFDTEGRRLGSLGERHRPRLGTPF